MRVQDMLSGQFHEMPDYGVAEPYRSGWPDPQMYGLGEVHDGLGNSLGLWFLPKLIGGAVSKIFGGGGGGGEASAPPPMTSAPAPLRVTCPPCPPCPACGTPFPGAGMMRPGFPPFPYPYPPPSPRRRRRR